METKQLEPRSSGAARPPCGRNWPLLVTVLCAVALGWAAAVGCASPPRSGPDFALMAQAWNTIQKQYVDHSAVQPTELTYGAINGMVDALGDTGHSTFLTPAMVRQLKSVQHGEFKGVGLELQMKAGHVVVVAPIDNSPAQRAGLKAKDILLKVNGQEITDWPLQRVVEQITGPAGTKVALTVEDPRNGETREVNLVRASIKLRNITWHQLPGRKVAHLRIATFDGGVTGALRKALQEIEHAGLQGILLDLRNNPGGILDEAVGVASQFLKSGNVLLAKDARGEKTPVPVEKGGLATDIPLVVLVNAGSASAAEIVAGALRDAGRAPLVGETTFGTGTVLRQFRLADGSALLLAIEEWLTPNGKSFWHKGLKPQFAVSLPAEVSPLRPQEEKDMTPQQLQARGDRQLLKALEILEQEAHVKREAMLPQ